MADLYKIEKWDLKYLSLAKFVSHWSKDKSTKVGAVIFDKDFRVISLGYNGLPQKICDHEEFLNDRDKKLKTIIHAEINAILFANKKIRGCTLATWPMMPCSNCASIVIQSGIERVVSVENNIPRWQESFEISKNMFQESGVSLKLYKDINEICAG